MADFFSPVAMRHRFVFRVLAFAAFAGGLALLIALSPTSIFDGVP